MYGAPHVCALRFKGSIEVQGEKAFERRFAEQPQISGHFGRVASRSPVTFPRYWHAIDAATPGLQSWTDGRTAAGKSEAGHQGEPVPAPFRRNALIWCPRLSYARFS